ncbi:metallophosphoesterase [Candidatus Bathyarchaeota archaeon]|nr:metallophosphoesterase [Candidatus Bathyarchaeota archaeon]
MGRDAKAVLKPLFPEPVLLIQGGGERVLVAADLHIGWEITLSGYGIYVPSQAKRFLRRIARIIRRVKPSTLVFLGDLKHTIGKLGKSEWMDVPEFLEAVKSMVDRVVIVPGNHDGDIEALTPEDVEITESGGIDLWGEVGLFHGHSWPKPELFNCRTLVMGHIHPAVTFRDRFSNRFLRRVWVKADIDPCCLSSYIEKRALVKRKEDFEVRSERLIIMPSFNGFMKGRALNEATSEELGVKAISPILRSRCVDIENSELYLLDGVFLGMLGEVREITSVLL